MIKKNDVVTIKYTGRVKKSGRVFDTTSEKIAKENNVWNKKIVYCPVTIITGQGFLIPGLDEELEGKKVGESFSAEIPPEKAFGKKRSELIKLIPGRMFKKQDVKPSPGMSVMVDNSPGTIVTVSPGRVVVDFNHPLAGKVLEYDVEVVEKVTSPKKIVDSILVFLFGEEHGFSVEKKKKKIIIKCDKEIKESLQKKIKELVKETLKNKYSLIFKLG